MFEEMRRCVGFTERDEANVRSLAPLAAPLIPAVLDRLYEELSRYPTAKSVLSGGKKRLERQRPLYANWLAELFAGRFDEAYFRGRIGVGQAHARAGLPQHYMLTAMELIWRELQDHLGNRAVPNIEDKLRSLHKLLMLELATMLESYKESYSEQVRKRERRAVEEKLIRAEHLAEIGQLAASLAHEIKNPLAGISGAIQVIREAMAPEDPHQPIVAEILGQIKRLDATVKDLLLYARPTPPRATKFALHEVVTRVLRVLREEPALQRVLIEHYGGPTDAFVFADDAQIEQLLINLIINAAHASADGGVIRLSIESNSDRVTLTVKDRGVGMAPEVRDHAFEAFFTTKARGTGLGLSICRRIVDAHGGNISLESEVGRGTTVVVDLPRSDVAHPPSVNK